jgi:ribosomal protein S27AE
MADHDPEQERQRLSKLYAEMSDGELDAIAADSAELTDVARQALTDELARRRPGKAALASTGAGQGHDSVELADVVSIRKFRDLHEALLAKGALDSAAIESFLVDDNMIRMDWFWSNLIGGIKLCVKQEDAEAALDLLEQSIPGEFEVEGVGQYEQPRCPKCRSLDIVFEHLNQPVAWVSAYVLAPIALHRKRWVCHSCGEQWRETEDNGAAT